jgi:hypothetical protein
MIAAGNIRVLAGVTGPIIVPGLPFTPRRIFFRAATTTNSPATTWSFGIWSADRADSPEFPQQACHEYSVNDGDSVTTVNYNSVAYVRDDDFAHSMVLICNGCADNAIQLTVYVNDLVNITYIQWVATP